jgi:hypothetical protein
LHVEALCADASKHKHSAQETFQHDGQRGKHLQGKVLPKGGLRAKAEVDCRPIQQSADEGEDQEENAAHIADILRAHRLPVNRYSPVRGREAGHAVLGHLALLNRLLRDAFEADLLVHGKGEACRDDKVQKERKQPVGAAQEVGEGLAGRDEGVDNALYLRKRFTLGDENGFHKGSSKCTANDDGSVSRVNPW